MKTDEVYQLPIDWESLMIFRKSQIESPTGKQVTLNNKKENPKLTIWTLGDPATQVK